MALGRPLGGMGSGGMSRAGSTGGRLGGAGSAKPGASKVPGKPDVTPNRAEVRMAKLRDSMQAGKSTAKSAAHAGVVARPMDKNLSKILENRRAEMQSSASSVARLGKEDAGSSSVGRLGETPGEAATSVNRLGEAASGGSTATSVGRLGEAGRVNDLTQSGSSVARLGKNEQHPSYLPPPPPKPPTTGKMQPPVDLFGDL